MTEAMLGESPDKQTLLGRLRSIDERDKQYLLRPEATDRPGEEAIERGWRYWWQDGHWGDQWYTPQCVAYAWTHFIEDGPVTHAPHAPQREAVHGQGAALLNPGNVYAEAQTIDEWAGTDYDGTSVRAGAKVLQRLGLIGGYRWAYDIDTIVMALLVEGPLVVGTSWYAEMSEPVAGQVRPRGAYQGGHAYVLNGVNRNTGMVRIKNSWGRGWSIGGNAVIDFDDLAMLLEDWGEACIATELNLAA